MDKQQTPETYYDGLIAAYERAFKPWESRADKIVKRYRDEQRAKQDSDQTKFNILWSNVNTLVPACYSRVPMADVGRRFRDQDSVGRVASLILERALTFEMEHYADYRATMRETVLDRFLPGRGTAWARYEPHFKANAQVPEDGLEVTEDTDEAETKEQIEHECAPVDYVHWKDFGHNIARTWEEVHTVWRRVFMYEEGVAERFGKEQAKKLSYDAMPEDKKKDGTQQDVKKQAIIYEIWDKQKKQAIWLSRAKPKVILDTRDDPLGLQEFFPCPRPLYATMTNDTLVPVPDFALYQDQARELDILADRIDGLIRMLKVMGCYDSFTPELARLFTEGVNGTLIPVKNFAAFAEKKGLAGSIDLVDLKPIYEAIKVCFEAVREVVNLIYQITGISDIVRGQTEAGETLGAQQLKVNFVGLRLGDMKRDVARFATDLLQLKAQIICQHFQPQTVAAMAAVEQLSPADQELIPQAMLLLFGEARLQDPEGETSNPLRAFRIEVNADSLVQIDEEQEKKDATEFLGGISRFLESAANVGAAAPQMIPVMLELMKWSLTKFKIGKNIEGTIDQALEQFNQAAQQPQGQDPALMAEQKKAEMEAALEEKRLMMEDQRHQREMSMKEQQSQREMAFKEKQTQQEMAFKAQAHQSEMGMRQEESRMNSQNALQMHEMTTSAKKEIEGQRTEASARPAVQIDAQGAMQQVAQDITQMAQANQQALMAIVKQMEAAIQAMAQAAIAPREHTVMQRDMNGKVAKSISRVAQ